MTRAATGDTVVVKPGPNIYTVLLGAGIIATAMALVIVIMRAQEMGYKFFG